MMFVECILNETVETYRLLIDVYCLGYWCSKSGSVMGLYYTRSSTGVRIKFTVGDYGRKILKEGPRSIGTYRYNDTMFLS